MGVSVGFEEERSEKAENSHSRVPSGLLFLSPLANSFLPFLMTHCYLLSSFIHSFINLFPHFYFSSPFPYVPPPSSSSLCFRAGRTGGAAAGGGGGGGGGGKASDDKRRKRRTCCGRHGGGGGGGVGWGGVRKARPVVGVVGVVVVMAMMLPVVRAARGRRWRGQGRR